jgi:nitrite reductase/ring-hydroxylating ferredoxin subunit
VSALPTVASGVSDWNDTSTEDRRIGFVHAGGNSVGILLEIASWSARRRGHHVRGAVLGATAIGVMTVAGYLGGHLVFARRVGSDFETPVIPDAGWHAVCRADDLADSTPLGVDVNGVAAVVVRRGAEVYALAAACTHAGGPLDRGSVENGAITCPWHGSRFCLRDGSVVRGPAASPEPTYETRLRSGVVEIRRRDLVSDRASANAQPARTGAHA